MTDDVRTWRTRHAEQLNEEGRATTDPPIGNGDEAGQATNGLDRLEIDGLSQDVDVSVVSGAPAGSQWEATLDPWKTLQLLRTELKFTERDLATATGVNVRTVRRWTAKEASPQTERIDDLLAIVRVLQPTLKQEHIPQWLRSRSRYLDDERPIELLKRGEFKRVREAAQAFVEGDYI